MVLMLNHWPVTDSGKNITTSLGVLTTLKMLLTSRITHQHLPGLNVDGDNDLLLRKWFPYVHNQFLRHTGPNP